LQHLALHRDITSVVGSSARIKSGSQAKLQFDAIAGMYAQAAQIAITKRHQP
jgi:hypothetical protein